VVSLFIDSDSDTSGFCSGVLTEKTIFQMKLNAFIIGLRRLNGVVKVMIACTLFCLIYILICFLRRDGANSVEESRMTQDSILISLSVAGPFYCLIYKRETKK
jgi:hypothetical protein